MLVGFAARRFRLVGEDFASSLSAIIFTFVFPALIIRALQAAKTELGAGDVAWLIGVSLGMFVVMYLLGTLYIKIARPAPAEGRILRVGMLFPNFTFMALPVFEAFFGATGLIYITIFTLPVRIAFYLLPGPLLQEPGHRGRPTVRDLCKALLTPPMIGLAAGLLLLLLNLELPLFLDNALGLLAGTASPLGMIVAGLTLPQTGLRKAVTNPRLYLYALFRLALAPAVMLPLAFLPLPAMVARTAIVYAALPLAASTVVFAKRFNAAPDVYAQSILITTLLSLLTLPVWHAVSVWVTGG